MHTRSKNASVDFWIRAGRTHHREHRVVIAAGCGDKGNATGHNGLVNSKMRLPKPNLFEIHDKAKKKPELMISSASGKSNAMTHKTVLFVCYGGGHVQT